MGICCEKKTIIGWGNVWSMDCARPRGRPKTSTDDVQKDFRACKLNREDAMDHSRRRKQIEDDWWSGQVWVGKCFFWYRLTWVVPEKMERAIKRLCVCFTVSYNAFSALTLLVGQREEHSACKNWVTMCQALLIKNIANATIHKAKVKAKAQGQGLGFQCQNQELPSLTVTPNPNLIFKINFSLVQSLPIP